MSKMTNEKKVKTKKVKPGQERSKNWIAFHYSMDYRCFGIPGIPTIQFVLLFLE